MTETPVAPAGRIDFVAIEKRLSELWRQNGEGESGVTRAAIWNVVGHSAGVADAQLTSEVLARVSATIPQRTILITADRSGTESLSAEVSANHHETGGGKSMLSEQISIAAGGDRVNHIPSLMNALLIPDMPVAAWWVGDLPHEHESYVESLLEPVDRLIIDSSRFDSPEDLKLVARIAGNSECAPADLNWVRLEEWRLATAALFDAPEARTRVRTLRGISLTLDPAEAGIFGERVEALYYVCWLVSQLGLSFDGNGRLTNLGKPVDCSFESLQRAPGSGGAISRVALTFDDGAPVTIERDDAGGSLRSSVGGEAIVPPGVTPAKRHDVTTLLVRQLSREDTDEVFARVLNLAIQLGEKLIQ